MLQGVPILPLLILATLIFTAVAADFLAPHNPEVGNLRYRYRPPVWQDRELGICPGHRPHGPRYFEPAHLWVPHLPVGGGHSMVFAGTVGTTLGIISAFMGMG